jgi:hypothetical protein
MIWKFKVRGETDVFRWIDLAAVMSMTADCTPFEIDIHAALDDEVMAIEVDIIPIDAEETHAEAVTRVIEAWTLCRRRLGAWK